MSDPTHERKVAVIANEDIYMGFRALGIEVHDPAGEKRSAGEILASLSPAEYAVVYVAEDIGGEIWEEISRRNRETPQAVILIPAGIRATGAASERIKELVRRAVGADIG